MYGIIFGGSFNPFHDGHEALMKSCRDHLGSCHIYILPVPAGRLSEMPVPDRMHRLNLLLQKMPDVSLIDRAERECDLLVFNRIVNEIELNSMKPAALVGADVLTRDTWSDLMLIVLPVADVFVGNRIKFEITPSIWKETLIQAEKFNRVVVLFPHVSKTSSTVVRSRKRSEDGDVG